MTKKRTTIKLFSEQILCWKLCGSAAAIQIAPKKIIIDLSNGIGLIEINSSFIVQGLSLSQNRLALWNDSTLEIFEYGQGKECQSFYVQFSNIS